MIEIDIDFYRKCEFSGRVVVSFDKGVMQRISIEETVHFKDPSGRHKLLKHGIRQQGADPAAPVSYPQDRAGS